MDNRIYGYARVSTREQNEDRQIEALTKFGVPFENIIPEDTKIYDTILRYRIEQDRTTQDTRCYWQYAA